MRYFEDANFWHETEDREPCAWVAALYLTHIRYVGSCGWHDEAQVQHTDACQRHAVAHRLYMIHRKRCLIVFGFISEKKWGSAVMIVLSHRPGVIDLLKQVLRSEEMGSSSRARSTFKGPRVVCDV